MSRKQTQELLSNIKDVLQSECDTRILPEASVISINEYPGRQPLKLEIKVQYEVGVWNTYVLTLSERKKARP